MRERFLLVTSGEDVTRRSASLAALGLDGVVVAGGLPAVVPGLRALAAALRAGLADAVSTQEPP